MIIYLSFAFLHMLVDAVSSQALGTRYKPLVSAIFSLFWPITTPVLIFFISKLQGPRE